MAKRQCRWMPSTTGWTPTSQVSSTSSTGTTQRCRSKSWMACAQNGHRWVFVAPVTDLALNLRVHEIATGQRWQYRSPRGGQTAKPRSDTMAVVGIERDPGMDGLDLEAALGVATIPLLGDGEFRPTKTNLWGLSSLVDSTARPH